MGINTNNISRIKNTYLRYFPKRLLNKYAAPKEIGMNTIERARQPKVFITAPRPEYITPVNRIALSKCFIFRLTNRKTKPEMQIRTHEIVTILENSCAMTSNGILTGAMVASIIPELNLAVSQKAAEKYKTAIS